MEGTDVSARRAAQEQWSRNPAGVVHAKADEGTEEFYRQMSESRYRIQPWHPDLIRSFAPSGRLLEIGSGAGTDLALLASSVESSVGIDLAHHGAWLTSTRLRLEGRRGGAMVSDAEQMAFPDAVFDAVYSFGVIHHTDHPERVTAEAARVLRPGGRAMIAVYHRWSLTTLDLLIRYVVTGKFLRMAWRNYLPHVEYGHDQGARPPLVRLYSRREAGALLSSTTFADVQTTGRHPTFMGRMFPGTIADKFGWYVIITGVRR